MLRTQITLPGAILCLSFLLLTGIVSGQTGLLKKYRTADSLMNAGNLPKAYSLFRNLEATCDAKDTLYNYILWYYAGTVTQIEKQFRESEKFDSSLHYGRVALAIIQKAIPYFNDAFAAREYWMTKNIVVSYNGLGKRDSANVYKDLLYKAYKENRLPKGLNEYFNFSFFKWDNKNVWGYEWFEELPEDRFSRSFSKVVYYVYSTKPDGNDDEQLYRLHVLMFHKLDPESPVDYVLTKRLDTAKEEVSGTLYAYTYSKDIDYKKLDADIREVLKGNYEPDTKSTIKKQR